jgi:acyl transferase domain-containing protein
VCTALSEWLRDCVELKPVALIGHSLGEYTALAAAGLFADDQVGMHLLRERARLIEEAREKVRAIL